LPYAVRAAAGWNTIRRTAARIFDLEKRMQHHERLLTHDNIDNVFTKDQLMALAAHFGVEVEGTGANGNILKEDLQQALHALIVKREKEANERLLQVRSEKHFHDGMIPNGTNWKPGEVRRVPGWVYRQLKESDPHNWTVLNG
jgi:hypothetical protein